MAKTAGSTTKANHPTYAKNKRRVGAGAKGFKKPRKAVTKTASTPKSSAIIAKPVGATHGRMSNAEKLANQRRAKAKVRAKAKANAKPTGKVTKAAKNVAKVARVGKGLSAAGAAYELAKAVKKDNKISKATKGRPKGKGGQMKRGRKK